VIVVGGGVMGSATAWWLARRGVEVVLLEQFGPGHTRGSSHGGSRIFRLAYTEDAFVALARQALDLWREVEDDAGARLVDITGGLDHGDPDEVDAVAAALLAAGRSVERLDAGDAQARWPGMRFDGAVVYSLDSGRVRADAAVAAFQRRARGHGATLRFETPVLRIDAARRRVDTADGELMARRSIVVTAGAWTAGLLVGRDAASHIELPKLTVTEEQVFHFPVADGDATAWPSFIHHQQTPVYGLLTPGDGVKVAEHHAGAVTDPDERTFVIDAAGRDRVAAYVEHWLPGLRPSAVSAATCLYTNTPDGTFVIERHGDLVIGSPCSGHGFKFAPVIGRRLADLAVGRFVV
jgi:sarcosine oxidase